MIRRVRSFLGAVVAPACVGAALLLPAGPLAAAPSGHPHFQDQGTLRWYGTWAEASAVARAEGRVVFMDMGRHACGGCQTLIERVLPDARVRTRLARVAVGWAVDADRREPFVDQLRARHLPRETMLPMIGFVRPDGAWITGSAGSVGLDAFLAQLARAESVARPGPQSAPAAPAPAAPYSAPRAAPSAPPPSAHAHLPPPVLRRAPSNVAAPRAAPQAPAPPPSSPCAVPSPALDDRISCCVVENPDCGAPAPCAPPPCAPPASLPAPEPVWEAPVVAAPEPRVPRAAPTPRSAVAPTPDPTAVAPTPTPRPRAFPKPPPLPTLAPTLAAPAPAPTPVPAPVAAPRIAPEAEARLQAALVTALGGRRREAAQALEQVRRDYAGTPAGADATQGLSALATLDDLAQLSDPRGPLASTLRANQRQELAGTRWMRLFPAY